MDITFQNVVFLVVAIFIAVFSILTVTTSKIMRSATYLLFVLFGTAAIYFLLGYTFLGAVQIMIYAGGIIILYVFSILLTNSEENINKGIKKGKLIPILITVLLGAGIIFFIIFTHNFIPMASTEAIQELSMKTIGFALVGGGKYQYILPFEILGVLLLACVIGGILIARKR
ncbi:MAG: NADH-quinone oxidoreductase subunit J [Bacteroidales bacterium]|jgi:NADH-quinone oxidoreductase subunit J